MVSARTELTFFTEAHMVLCFCVFFLMRTVLITHHFRCCRAVFTQSQGHFSSSCCLASKEMWGTRSWEDRNRTADPDCPKERPIPHGTVFSNKSWSEEGGKGDVVVMAFFFFPPRGTITQDETSFPGGGWTCVCWSKVVNKLLALLCLHVQLYF